jgi:hypothetical protein
VEYDGSHAAHPGFEPWVAPKEVIVAIEDWDSADVEKIPFPESIPEGSVWYDAYYENKMIVRTSWRWSNIDKHKDGDYIDAIYTDGYVACLSVNRFKSPEIRRLDGET